MNIIKKLFVNGKWSKLSKDALADDVSSSLLPPATAEDEGKVVSVTEIGEYGLSTVESGLPVATAQDAGKVVAVDETGAYELAEAGGANVLTLYCKNLENQIYAFKDEACELTYSYAEAEAALKNADVIKILLPDGSGGFNSPVFPYDTYLSYRDPEDYSALVHYINYTGNFESKVVFLAYARNM